MRSPGSRRLADCPRAISARARRASSCLHRSPPALWTCSPAAISYLRRSSRARGEARGLHRVRRVVGPACILATNTSSLSVTAMGETDRHRAGGRPTLHQPGCSAAARRGRAHHGHGRRGARHRLGHRERHRKRGVLVADAPRVRRQPGAATHDDRAHGRSSTAYPVDETDEAALNLGLPMSPSVLLQMVGPRVANHVLHTLNAAIPIASRPS